MPKRRNEYEGYNREVGQDQRIEYDASNNALYVGRADPGAADSEAKWQIYKMGYDVSNNMTALRWADGTDDFTKVWDDRASYTYLGI